MSIDFSGITAVSDQKGVVTQIADASGNVLWALSGGKVVLEVEKITSNTYAAETLYENEEFILLDIYPKTNGTVSVTYDGLTKTITDTSGAEEPNAQQVFFGTFNGVSDSVSTPASGELTIEGDCRAFGCGGFVYNDKSNTNSWLRVTAIKSFGETSVIPDLAFSNGLGGCTSLTNVKIPDNITNIGRRAFLNCSLTDAIIGAGVEFIDYQAFGTPNTLTLKTVEIFAVTPPEIGTYTDNNNEVFRMCFSEVGTDAFSLEEITVPKGCGNAYKTAEGWSQYADYITEAS